MEKSEHTLKPEWLKNNGNSNGGGSSSRSDDRSTPGTARNKSFVNGNGRSAVSERTTSAYFRRNSSSNGSGNSLTYSNFGGRNRRDREWEKDKHDYRDKDKLVSGNGRHRDFSNPPHHNTSSKLETDRSTRSQPIRNYNNDALNKGSSVGSASRETIGSDFPTLSLDCRTSVPDSGRTTPPGQSPAFRSLSSGISAAIPGEKWTSALAEVPMLVGSKGTAISSVQQPTASTPSLASGSSTGLNMAEALAQGHSRAHTAPQLSVETQRLEELAIKQSRQLIPVTPSMPKSSGNASDKRTKVGMLHHSVSSPLPAVHSPRGAPLKNDAAKVSTLGKLQILKPVREKNGTTPFAKDSMLSPTKGGSENGTAPNNPVPDRKRVLTVLEKRPTSQAKSRNDFFNLVRKKSIPNTSSAVENSLSDVESKESSTSADKTVEMDVALAPNTPRACENQISKTPIGPNSLKDVGDVVKCECNGKKHPSFDPMFSEEEESRFLRSMGWEEKAEDEDEIGLTEEEINTFLSDVTEYINSNPSMSFLQYINSNPSLEILLQGVQPKSQLPLNSNIG